MPELWGKKLTRQDLMRHVGSLDQVFGIRPVTCGAGKESMLRCLEIDNGAGLRLTVGESKALDLLQVSWKGMNLGFCSKAGLHAPWLSDEVGMSYRRNLGAGFLYTAGLSNVGGFCEEPNEYHYAHGALKNTPAETVASHMDWQGDECTLSVEAQVRESAFFGRNLLLTRRISTQVGSDTFCIHDTIENQDFAPAQLMLLYHMNIGFPILEEGAELVMNSVTAEAMSPHTLTDPDWRIMSAPIDNNEEYLYVHTLEEKDGLVRAAVFNDRLGLGLEVAYSPRVLQYLVEWKCMRSGDYALGILPSTCKPIGRLNGELTELKPFEKLEIELQLRVLTSRDQICD